MTRQRFINPFTDFGKLPSEAEIANYNQKELLEYEDDLKVYRDMKGVLETAKSEGIAEGIEQGIEQERRVQEERRKSDKIETAKELLKLGLSAKQIAAATKLSIKEIQKLS